jgi:hypothetical protein
MKEEDEPAAVPVPPPPQLLLIQKLSDSLEQAKLAAANLHASTQQLMADTLVHLPLGLSLHEEWRRVVQHNTSIAQALQE